MKTLVLITMTLILNASAFAGQVHSLQPGQTFALSNGDVVACFGMQQPPPPPPPPPAAWRCTLMISGLPPFTGKYAVSTKFEAQAMAKDVCERETAGRIFKDFDNQPYNPCNPPSSMSGIYMGYSCKNEAN